MKKIIRKILKSLGISSLLFLLCLVNGPIPVLADSVTDTYSDTTKINTGSSSDYVVSGGQLKMQAPGGNVAWWKMDETSGTSVTDSSGNSNTGTAYGPNVGYWKFDEASGNASDSTSNGDTLTNSGSTVVSGQSGYGNARNFVAASSQYLACTDTACGTTSKLDFDATTSFTYGAWFKSSTTGTAKGLISKKAGVGSSGAGYEVYTGSGNRWNCRISDGTNTALVQSTVATSIDGAWHHIACVVDRSAQTITAYLDDVAATPVTLLVSGSTYIGSLDSSEDFRVGTIGSTSPIDYFDGSIDDVRVYRSARTSSQISDDMNNIAPSIVNGEYSKARSLNGTSDYISFGTLTGGSAVKTIEFWVKPVTNAGEMIDLNGTNYVNASGGVISAPGSAAIYVNGSAGTTLTAGSWQHVAVTITGGVNASAVNIGKRGTSYFNGIIDDVRIYNYVRSATEITADMNNYSYDTSSTVVSNNLLATATGIDGIDEFVYNLSSLPVGTTTAAVSFSQDGTNWVNSSNVASGTDSLTIGANNTITIHSLTWSGSNFYYKVAFTSSDGTSTPTLDDVTLNYTSAGYTNTSTPASDTYDNMTYTNQSGSSNLSLTYSKTKISYATTSDIGTGEDGAIVITTGTKNINTDTIATGRTVADGVTYAVSAMSTNSVTTSSTVTGIIAGDEVLLINIHGDATNNGNAGTYEFLRVSYVSGTTLTFATSIQNTYGVGGNSDLTGQSIMVQRVPNYTNVTVCAGSNSPAGVGCLAAATLTANAWNGTTGGIVVFRANGTVTNGGTITANALGYRGGAGGAISTSGPGAGNGESYDGNASAGGYTAVEPSRGGGRSANEGTASPNNGVARGGGGGGGKDGSASDANDGGGGGGGGAYYGGGGGAGGAGDYQTVGKEGAAGDATGGTAGGGGGAGGNPSGAGGAPGSAGGNSGAGAGSGGQVGSGATCASGGGGQASGAGAGGGGGGGGFYGVANLSKIYFGSGGGGGGSSSSYGATSGVVGRDGGAGGGIVMIYGNTVTNSSTISANGANGVNKTEREGASGGGAGGSILIKYGSITAGTQTVTGGTKGLQSGAWGGGGGGGGVGRIYTTTATTTAATYNISATLVSTNLLTGISSIKSIDSFTYNLTSLPANTTAKVSFSQDGTNWYNSSGTYNDTNDLSSGTHTISLSTLGWSGSYFYYKIAYTSNGSATPSLDSITVNYTTATTSSISSTWAVCTPLQGKDWTIGNNCFFPKTGNNLPYKNIDGVDNGNLTVSAYKTLTIKGDQTIVRNNDPTHTVGKIIVNGTIAINDIPIGGVGGNVRDYSGNNNDALATGTTVVAGQYTKARYFNGTSDYIYVGALNSGTSIQTVDFWINPVATSGEIIDLNGSAYINYSGGNITTTGFNNVVIYVNGVATSAISTGSWQHVAVTTDTGINASAVNIGKRGSTYFNGTLDDIRIYSYARSSAQVTEDKNYVANPTGNSPIAWWRFEDGGQIKETNLWSKDVDGDGWTQTLETQDKAQTDTPGTGWVRRKDTVGSIFGTGRDGSVTFATNTNLSTWNHTGRTCTDGGEMVSYNITAFGSTVLTSANGDTVTTATLSPTPSLGCLAAGDDVLILNAQGATSAYSNAGNYELLRIYSVSGSSITFTTTKKKFYGSGASDDAGLGITTSTQRVVLQRIPQFQNVIINSGITVGANDWNGTTGGVVAFQTSGTLTNSGKIGGTIGGTVRDATGFRGGVGGTGFHGGYAGETYNGFAGKGIDNTANPGGGGGGTHASSGEASQPGTIGGGGGGGGGRYGIGGGGGYVGVGNGGSCSSRSGQNGSGSTGGNGGPADVPGNVDGCGGGGGTYGVVNLSQIYFGSGGGGGGPSGAQDGGCSSSYSGGDGGGIVFIMANTFTMNTGSTVTANGGQGSTDGCGTSANGSGSGGSVKIFAATATLGSNLITAIGGTTSTAAGNGRVAVGAVTITDSGTSNPTYTAVTAP